MTFYPGTEMNAPPNRIPALDLLRGMIIILMIITSYHGNLRESFPSLIQTFGCGLSIADLVVPTFFWMIGLSLSLSISSRLAKGATKYQLLKHVLRRSAALYAVGIALDASTCLDSPARLACLFESRLFGIFQRIALSYLFAAPVVIFTDRRGQFSILLATCLGYQIYLNGLDLQPCDPTYRRTVMTLIPGVSLILAGALVGLFVTTGCNVRGSRILTILGSVLVLASVTLHTSLPFFFQQLNVTACLLSTGVATLLYGLLSLVPRRHVGKVGCALLIALGENPLLLYVVSAMLYLAGHTIGIQHPSGSWISIWHYGWMFSTSVLGHAQLASLLMSLILIAMSASIAWWLSRKGIVIKI
ncbi:MAG: heparan-alpha-glucosaminide N-acetyltransferase domain-containing protein [Nitrospira sp.]